MKHSHQLSAVFKSLSILTRLITVAIISVCLLVLAKWIQRFARFMDKTEPGPAFVIIIGCVVGLSIGFFSADMRHAEVNTPLLQCLRVGLSVCFNYGFTSLATLYLVWEVFQGFKWLNKWSEDYQKTQTNHQLQ